MATDFQHLLRSLQASRRQPPPRPWLPFVSKSASLRRRASVFQCQHHRRTLEKASLDGLCGKARPATSFMDGRWTSQKDQHCKSNH